MNSFYQRFSSLVKPFHGWLPAAPSQVPGASRSRMADRAPVAGIDVGGELVFNVTQVR